FVEESGARREVRSATRLPLGNAVEGIENAVLRSGPLRVGDVAQVELGAEPAVGLALYDGRPGIYFQVNSQPGADTLQNTASVQAALVALGPELPEGSRFDPPVFRQADFVRTSIRSVGRAMALGGVLVVAVLWALLR